MPTKRSRKTAVQNLNTTSTVPEVRTYLSQCVGKICAYKNVKKDTEAKAWAVRLMEGLKANGLI